MRGVSSAKMNLNTKEINKTIIYKVQANRDTIGDSRRPIESTVKGRNGIERKINED